MKVIWLAQALAERSAAIEHIAQDDIRAALNQLDEIQKQTNRLAEHPELGRPSRLRPGVRLINIARTPFVVTYRIRPGARRIEIIHLVHTRQNWRG